jgi:uncharacterized protein involved in exopolysaccharide biosynthesis
MYVAQNLETAVASTDAANDWLRNQLDKLRTDLQSGEEGLQKFKKDNDILSVAFDDQSNMLREEMSQVNTALTQARAKLQEASARTAVLSSAGEDDPTTIASSELLKSVLLDSLRRDFEQAKRDKAALLGSGKGEEHPDVAAASQRVETTRAAILKEITNIKRAVGRDLTVLQREAGGLQGMFDQAREKAHNLNILEIEYNRLRRARDNTEKMYALVLERTKESDLTRMLRVNNIHIIDPPMLPRGAVEPRLTINLAAALFAATAP